MPFISDAIKQQVRERSGYSCEYCKTQERLIAMPLVVDHIFPTSLGGENVPSNLAAACYPCNQFKSAKTSGRINCPERGQGETVPSSLDIVMQQLQHLVSIRGHL